MMFQFCKKKSHVLLLYDIWMKSNIWQFEEHHVQATNYQLILKV